MLLQGSCRLSGQRAVPFCRVLALTNAALAARAQERARGARGRAAGAQRRGRLIFVQQKAARSQCQSQACQVKGSPAVRGRADAGLPLSSASLLGITAIPLAASLLPEEGHNLGVWVTWTFPLKNLQRVCLSPGC